MSFVEKIDQLNEAIGATFDQAFSAMRREVQDRLRDSHEELLRNIDSMAPDVPRTFVAHEDWVPASDGVRTEGRAAALAELREGLAALDRGRTQAEVLGALTASCTRFASRAAVLLWRHGELHGWGSDGFADAAPALRRVVFSPPASGPWAATETARRLEPADCAVLCGLVDSPLPAHGFLIPLVLRDNVVALVYADQLQPLGDAAPAADTAQDTAVPTHAAGGAADAAAGALAPLQSLVYVAALAIETLPFRQRAATATLALEPPAETSAAFRAGLGEAYPAAAAPSPEPAAEPAAGPAAAAAAESENAAGAAALAAEAALARPEPPEIAEVPATADRHETPADRQDSPAGAGRRLAPGAPFQVTPADLYDTPSVTVVKETAEIPQPPRSWGFEPAPEAPAVAPPGVSPFLEDASAASPTAPAAPPATPLPPAIAEQPALPDLPSLQSLQSPPGLPEITAGDDLGSDVPSISSVASAPSPAPPHAAASAADTMLLPHAALRDGGSSPLPMAPPSSIDERAPAAASSASTTGAQRLVTPTPFPVRGDRAGAAAGGSFAGSSSGNLETVGPVAVPPPPPSPTPLDTLAGGGTLRAVPSVGPLPAGPDDGNPSSITGAFETPRAGVGSGTPEVRPPVGVQGPGWAFATTRLPVSTGEESLHEEARRLARLLVSEIKLYNEEQVEAGRRNRDIYERLREDIDRSRQMYEERIEPRLRNTTDYFYQELVRILAAGDSKALGL